MALPPFEELLATSIEVHGGHGCPGQVLGVRLAMVGLREIGIEDPQAERKKFVVYVEIDRCAADAIHAVTGCRVGRRSLKMVDYGVMAATFARLDRDLAVRVTAREDSRERVSEFATIEGAKCERQVDAYRQMPEELLFDIERVSVTLPPEDLPGPPLFRVRCDSCGDYVQDRREIRLADRILCRACAGGAYYRRLPGASEERIDEGTSDSADEGLVRWTPAGVPMVGIAGGSGSGKTTLLEELIGRLSARGLRVGVLKHSSHRLSLDQPGKDTDRLYTAGASVVQAHDGEQRFSRRREQEPQDWPSLLAETPADLDLLIIEGHKRAPIPKLWVGSNQDDAFGEVSGIIGRVEGAKCGDEADTLVISCLQQAWARRPWSVVYVGASGASDPVRVCLGDDADAQLSPVPGCSWPLSALLAAMRWLPDRAWLLAPEERADEAREVARELLRLRRPGTWALSRPLPDDEEQHVALVEPQLRGTVERLALRPNSP